MSLNLRATVINILSQHPDQYYTARQLAEQIFSIKKEDCLEKLKNSKATAVPLKTEQDVIGQIVAEIGATRESIVHNCPNIKITAERPKKYYYSEKSDIEEVREVEQISLTNRHPEHDSYPMLCEYLYKELNVYPKRIDEKKSINSKGMNGNKWLHPDIVGLRNLSSGWAKEVIDCSSKYAFNKTSLWSFEVKIKINLSNVREYFFQTVSNSSWANYSYLVTQSIDNRAMDELRILCSGHHIGLIQLNCADPTESQILIPAIEKKELDWDMIDRIAKENADFKAYINLITEFYQTRATADLPAEYSAYINLITEFYQTGKIKEYEWNISIRPKN